MKLCPREPAKQQSKPVKAMKWRLTKCTIRQGKRSTENCFASQRIRHTRKRLNFIEQTRKQDAHREICCVYPVFWLCGGIQCWNHDSGARKERCNDKPYDILLGIHYGKRKATAVMSSDVCCCFCGVKGKHVYSTFRPFGMDRNAENGNTT